MKDEVVVVGAGVSGLTCAVRLLEAGYRVRVVAAEMCTDAQRVRRAGEPPSMCSRFAAAVWYPYEIQPAAKVKRWANESLRRYRILAEHEENGVSIIRFNLLLCKKLNPVDWDLLEECEREIIPVHELPPGYKLGLRLRVPLIDTDVFLPFLQGHVQQLGGTIEHRALDSKDEMPDLGSVVVNCTGLGARALCGDKKLYPLRGQVLRVQTSMVKRWSLALPRDGRPIYVIPRKNDCVLGGTEERGEWGEQPNEKTLRKIEKTCRWLEPSLDEGYTVDSRLAGLRPGRKTGVRLEVEPVDDCTVIHNYGHGGAGFTVAWGCAEEVKELVDQVFELRSAAAAPM